MKERIQLTVLLCLLFISPALRAGINIGNLRCEMRNNPVGVDITSPRLSWMIDSELNNVRQLAYEVIVASSPEKLSRNEGDIWYSGKVNSDQSHLVQYGGEKLRSNQQCFWKVKSYTNQGETSWSETGCWSMGLLNENSWASQWIGMDRAAAWDEETKFSRLSARYLRKEFELDRKIRRATLHISGLGMYELYLNGKKVGDQVLAPAPTDYNKTVLYNSFDVTEMLATGSNAVGVILGNGRYYTMRQDYKPYKIANYGYPKMRMNLIVEYSDGKIDRIKSDNSWRMTADGPIRSNNEYDGEEYDARKELGRWANAGYDDSGWLAVERVAIPAGEMKWAPSENMKVVRQIAPVSISRISDNKYMLDMGQNMAGWIRFKVTGNEGDSVRLRFGELLQENGDLYVANLRDARVTDTYVLNGSGVQEWAPRFVYHGFRYVEISGYPGEISKDNFIGEVVSDQMEETGSFTCSHPVINQVYQNAWWGILGNYKGMPVDCPQRNERQPWLGDRTVGCLGESYLFGNGLLYSKWMDDIRDAQRADGCIPDVAPAYWNYYSDNVTWPAAFLTGADMVYTQFGDIRPIQKNYPAMQRWIGHMVSDYLDTETYIIDRDKYGDWCVPPESLDMIHSRDSARRTDGSLIATAYLYKMLGLMERFASLQQLYSDQQEYRELALRIRAGFNDRFFNRDSVCYGNNTATANILPLAFDLVPDQYREKVSRQVVNNILVKNKGHIPTGLIGTQWLMRTLSEAGRGDVAYVLASNKTYPSWGYMAQQGATTIWELWNGNTAAPQMNSGNHVMLLGDLITWFYQHLAGIRSDDVKSGFKELWMAPDFNIQELGSVDASYQTPYGLVVSKWNKTLSRLNWSVRIPANTTARIRIPVTQKGRVVINGQPLADHKEIRRERTEGDAMILTVPSGCYELEVSTDVAAGNWRKGIVEDEFLYEFTSFPECHGATIAETPTGLVASFFGGTKEGNPDCCIWVCRKTSGGWTKPQQVADGIVNDTLRKACYNPVLYQVPQGDLLLFYKVGRRVSDWKGYLIRSSDGGVTWTSPEELPAGFLGPIKNKPEMISGKLVCPSSTEGNGWKAHFEFTSDLGKTWETTGPVNGQPWNIIQPSILKHRDGRLQMICRSRNQCLVTAYSKDNGLTWSEPEAMELPNNNSGTDAVTLKDGRHLLVYNHVRTPDGQKKGARTPLNVALSKDGEKWFASLLLETSPVSQYSYPSVIQGEDGMVHIIYTWRRQRIKYVKVDPSKLKMKKFMNGLWPAKE